VYVGKHFPLDVICGALFGMLIGYLVYALYKKVKARYKIN
jgi:undecaprenyl-diphosphatase